MFTFGKVDCFRHENTKRIKKISEQDVVPRYTSEGKNIHTTSYVVCARDRCICEDGKCNEDWIGLRQSRSRKRTRNKEVVPLFDIEDHQPEDTETKAGILLSVHIQLIKVEEGLRIL